MQPLAMRMVCTGCTVGALGALAALAAASVVRAVGARQRSNPRALAMVVVSGLLAVLTGCATKPQVQSLATGRSDLSAHALTGQDLDTLRREAQRLCPLGGEILRQSGQPEPRVPTGSRWHVLLDTTVQWFDAPPASSPAAQLVVLCREPGDHARLPALPSAGAAGATRRPLPATPTPTSAQTSAQNPAQPLAQTPIALTSSAAPAMAALPIGPITPEW